MPDETPPETMPETMPETPPETPLLEVEGLVTEFSGERGAFRAVDGVSFSVARGRTVGLVGESGCGKSVTALSILRLIPDPPGRIVAGSIRLDGVELLGLSERELCRVRGNRIAMIFQEPMTSLNPVYTAGAQVAEAVRLHRKSSRSAAWVRAVELLRLAGIPAPEERAHAYPHQLSGGMRQRVMIAMALACSPALLLADEPTTALDVTVQAQILELLGRLQRELGMSILLITHDLGVVAEACDEVLVMYAGRIVERSPTAAFLAGPHHPYGAGLLRSVPAFGERDGGTLARAPLPEIPGTVPAPWELPEGCRFQNRCALVTDRCRAEEPELVPVAGELGRFVRCHHPIGVAS